VCNLNKKIYAKIEAWRNRRVVSGKSEAVSRRNEFWTGEFLNIFNLMELFPCAKLSSLAGCWRA
jgi:hypothetical protein